MVKFNTPRPTLLPEELPEVIGAPPKPTDKGIERDLYLEELDSPRHALEYGGINGEATIAGIPVPNGKDASIIAARKTGIVMEPVPVTMRDAVTIDTAVRLTGVARQTLQRAAAAGRLPVLKVGPDTAPYLVRLRDVVTYLVTMWTERRARREMNEAHYIGFPEWMVAAVSESWPTDKAFKPGNWQSRAININRGGRPRGYTPGKIGVNGYSKNGIKLGRPARDAKARTVQKVQPRISSVSHDNLGAEKEAAPEGNHPQGPPPPAAPTAPQDPNALTLEQRRALPKWDPRWLRPGG